MKACGWQLVAMGAVLLTAPSASMAQDVFQLSRTPAGIETIRATVDGRDGLYIFDSGIGTSGITPAMAAAIGCKPWGKVTGFRAIGERVDTPRCNSSTVKIGAYQRTLSQLSVLDLEKFMGPSSAGLSGAIGLDLFAGRSVTLDVAHHQLTVEDPASLETIRKTATEVPIRLVRVAEGAALTVDIGVPTSSGTAWMELDTGNYGPAMVDRTIASLFGLKTSAEGVQQWNAKLTPQHEILGPVMVKDLILDGNLGREALRHWLVTLDLADGRGWISKVSPTALR